MSEAERDPILLIQHVILQQEKLARLNTALKCQKSNSAFFTMHYVIPVVRKLHIIRVRISDVGNVGII